MTIESAEKVFEALNISVVIGKYEKDSDGGAFYIGDEEETCVSQDLYVNAWRPLPEPYRPERSDNHGK